MSTELAVDLIGSESVRPGVQQAGARGDDEYWGPIYGLAGPRIRLAAQVAEFIKLVELVDAAAPGFGNRTVSRFVDDCGTPHPGRRPPGWKGPWPPHKGGFDPVDLVTIGAQLAAASREIVDVDLAGTTLKGGLALINQGAAQLRG